MKKVEMISMTIVGPKHAWQTMANRLYTGLDFENLVEGIEDNLDNLASGEIDEPETVYFYYDGDEPIYSDDKFDNRNKFWGIPLNLIAGGIVAAIGFGTIALIKWGLIWMMN